MIPFKIHALLPDVSMFLYSNSYSHVQERNWKAQEKRYNDHTREDIPLA